jgi:hypothetical protein
MQHSGLAYIRRLPELASLSEHADHVDVKTVIGSVDLRTFLANMLSSPSFRGKTPVGAGAERTQGGDPWVALVSLSPLRIETYMLSYQPEWVIALYGVRAIFVRFLGMRQHGIPRRQYSQ